MRYLFVVSSMYSHFHPMEGIAAALAATGETVAFATSPWFSPLIRAKGFSCFDIGLHNRGRGGDATRGPEVELEASLRDVLALARQWVPDVIVGEPFELSGSVAGRVLERPYATIGSRRFLSQRQLAAMMGTGPGSWGAALQLACVTRGIRVPSLNRLLYRYLYLDPVPPWFQSFRAPPIRVLHPVRPSAPHDHPGSAMPAWLGCLGDAPTVLVTIGTVLTDRVDILEIFLSGLAGKGLNIICTVGADREVCEGEGWSPELERRADLRRLTSSGNHLFVDGFVPHAMVLPYCDAVVCHGGYNTVISALSFGVPLLIVPFDQDTPDNARRCRELGVGLSIPLSRLSRQRVGLCVDRLLGEESFSLAARHLSSRLASLPGPERGAELLMRLARDKQPQLAERPSA
jgi:UDP:flavonoid glycosyltransferase YjiC (YdhE family)